MQEHITAVKETRTVNITAQINGSFHTEKDRQAIIADLEDIGWRVTDPAPTDSDGYGGVVTTVELDAEIARMEADNDIVLQQNRYGRFHHVGSDERCLPDCPGCERKGLQERVRLLLALYTSPQTPDGAPRPAGEINAAWAAIERGWDIEPRSYFEKEAPRNGFKYPLAQAIHHLWKRCVKENPDFLREPAAPKEP